jgi:serine/threonine protein kinase
VSLSLVRADAKVFARKILRSLDTSAAMEVEVRETKRMAENGDENVIKILQLGLLPNSPYQFVDMEQCDFSLESYVSSPETHPFQLSTSFPNEGYQSQIWDIIMQITRGVAHLHHNNAIHLNLKPRNGSSFLLVANVQYYTDERIADGKSAILDIQLKEFHGQTT